jgi:uncharacterized protein YprB with RNaseH-like and TPR domain
MLRSTYIHCPGIGQVTERRLWASGALTWADVLRSPDALPVGPHVRRALSEVVAESALRLDSHDARWFAARLPAREHWRAFREFRGRVAYLDIETTGGTRASDLTVVGVYDGLRIRQFVRGDNLDEFPAVIETKDLLVTFFGSGFDLPFLRNAFGIEFPHLHIDLCHVLRRLGHRGGLKAVEGQFGIQRPLRVRGLDGFEAVRLWWQWANAADDRALETLLLYNAEDVVNLETLLDAAYPRLLAHAGLPESVPAG